MIAKLAIKNRVIIPTSREIYREPNRSRSSILTSIGFNMVFFFQTEEGYVIYMGADKFENEELIKYGRIIFNIITSFILLTN